MVKKGCFYFSAYVVVAIMLAGMVYAPARAATRYEAGVATSATLLWMSDQALNDRLNDIQDLGVTWIRVDFSWHAIQPSGPTAYNWDMYDRVVREAGRHHLKILAVLAYPPPWAQEPRCAAQAANKVTAEKCNPRGANEFGQFAGAVALRYKGQSVRAWEIWNEPNLSAYWKTIQPDNTTAVDPAAYASLANAAAAQIHHNYPDSAIITGGLAPLFEPYSRGMRQSDYLVRILPLLNANLFNGIGVHPYTWPILPSTPAVYNAFYTVNNGKSDYNLRTILTAAGWGDKEIWGTEYGASTKGVQSSSFPTKQYRPDHVTEDQQAQIIAQGVYDWYAKPNVGPLFMYTDSDQWLLGRKNEAGFGMRRSDGSKKPAYDAFRTAVKQL